MFGLRVLCLVRCFFVWLLIRVFLSLDVCSFAYVFVGVLDVCVCACLFVCLRVCVFVCLLACLLVCLVDLLLVHDVVYLFVFARLLVNASSWLVACWCVCSREHLMCCLCACVCLFRCLCDCMLALYCLDDECIDCVFVCRVVFSSLCGSLFACF